MLTLWDLIEPITKALRPKPPRPVVASRPARPQRQNGRKRRPAVVTETKPKPIGASAGVNGSGPRRARANMADRYDAVTAEMLREYKVRVRKWRTSMSGVAWYVTYRDGTVQRLIEAPRPRGPMSAAIFLHEIGHHAIGFDVYSPRCLEEYHAWKWAIEQMEARGLNVTDAVRRRMHNSLHYAVQKARRRGIKRLPEELRAYTQRLPRGRRKSHRSETGSTFTGRRPAPPAGAT